MPPIYLQNRSDCRQWQCRFPTLHGHFTWTPSMPYQSLVSVRLPTTYQLVPVVVVIHVWGTGLISPTHFKWPIEQTANNNLSTNYLGWIWTGDLKLKDLRSAGITGIINVTCIFQILQNCKSWKIGRFPFTVTLVFSAHSLHFLLTLPCYILS